MNRWFVASICLFAAVTLNAGEKPGVGSGAPKFDQLEHLLPTPTATRTASGAPGPGYWQQRADYQIAVTLDDEKQQIRGSQCVTYHNRSPHSLTYIWLQLDQNRFRPDSDDVLTKTAPNFKKFPYRTLADLLARQKFQGGVELGKVTDKDGNPLEYLVVKTMMRLELPTPLGPGESFVFCIDWQHNILDGMTIRARGGYEYFAEDKNYIYEIAQWYPRVASYTDYQGWQHKQFLGRGEFTLELGNYTLDITVPADHVVTATGELKNAEEVLTAAQNKRLNQARQSGEFTFIVTPKEAASNQKSKATDTKTWRFEAENVRDVAFASSRKFIWDVIATKSGSQEVLAMSFYPNEAEPLWSQYSTHAVVHTIDVYSQYSFDYPYPVAISVNGPIGGMEYPMICFNKPRPYKDGTYWDIRQDPDDHTWERSKLGLISVVIHEVGHNYFPMIVNSDERQWTWMDEGLNSFLQFLAEQAWHENYPSRRGEPQKIIEYMLSKDQVPIMTNSESILQFGNNSYAKPAAALNILRESIMGRDLFDYAFKQYAQRWKFKRPTPADFFRSMEDASGVDLDWFWRGWFYTTDHVDIALERVTHYQLDSHNPEIENKKLADAATHNQPTTSQRRNRGEPTRVGTYAELRDFYDDLDEFAVTPYDYAKYQQFLQGLQDKEKVLLNTDKFFYAIDFANIGGLVAPLPLAITYADGSSEEMLIPAEIWRKNAQRITKLLICEKAISSIVFDPNHETADADIYNNSWPRQAVKTRFQLFKEKEKPNPMLRMSPDDWKRQEP